MAAPAAALTPNVAVSVQPAATPTVATLVTDQKDVKYPLPAVSVGASAAAAVAAAAAAASSVNPFTAAATPTAAELLARFAGGRRHVGLSAPGGTHLSIGQQSKASGASVVELASSGRLPVGHPAWAAIRVLLERSSTTSTPSTVAHTPLPQSAASTGSLASTLTSLPVQTGCNPVLQTTSLPPTSTFPAVTYSQPSSQNPLATSATGRKRVSWHDSDAGFLDDKDDDDLVSEAGSDPGHDFDDGGQFEKDVIEGLSAVVVRIDKLAVRIDAFEKRFVALADYLWRTLQPLSTSRPSQTTTPTL